MCFCITLTNRDFVCSFMIFSFRFFVYQPFFRSSSYSIMINDNFDDHIIFLQTRVQPQQLARNCFLRGGRGLEQLCRGRGLFIMFSIFFGFLPFFNWCFFSKYLMQGQKFWMITKLITKPLQMLRAGWLALVGVAGEWPQWKQNGFRPLQLGLR